VPVGALAWIFYHGGHGEHGEAMAGKRNGDMLIFRLLRARVSQQPSGQM
jgi:hypothetical protein